MNQLKKLYPHALVLLGFVLISLIYFYPVLQGKQILQSDIVQFTGMAKEQNDFRASDHQEPFWTNSGFGGMPTYQLGAKYPHDYIGMIDDAIRFLPRPADYLFLYFLSFYGLLLVLKIDPLKAFFGALAFGFSTYLIIILGVGHNAKAHAIGYLPIVVAGVILVFKKKYILGGLLTMFAVALEINANHFQMTYYLLLLLLILSGYFTYKLVKEKDFKSLLLITGTFIVAGIFAIGANATSLLATAEYADFSMRSKSELTFNPDGSKNETTSAMNYDYITAYSYGIAESFNLIAPRLFGGSGNEALGTDSKTYEFLLAEKVPETQAAEYVAGGMPTYWGDQPGVAAPAYIGAVVFFLAVLAFFTDKRKIKYAFLGGAIASLLLSWGKNFSLLTDFFIDFVPLYDKFRAVSSIQVILELCIPVLAVIGLHSFFKLEKELTWKALWQSGAVSMGILLLLFLCKGLFNFSGVNDSYYLESYGPQFLDALKSDRMTLYSADLLRSGFFIMVSVGVLWLFIKNRFTQNTTIILVGLLMVSDLFLVDKKYVDAKAFVSSREVEVPFVETTADIQILKDTTNYRVFDVAGHLTGRTPYFHKSIGGYSAVNPRRMEQLFNYQISKNNIEILNMLNVKYIVQTDSTGVAFPVQNPDINGNAWFVKNIKLVQTADQEMKALDKLNTKNVAVMNATEFEIKNKAFAKDSVATVTLDSYKPNHLKYTAKNSNDGLAVFSEMYYKNGWKATIDGKETEIFRANYALRALQIPAGKHTIEFKFEPQVVKTGSTIALISSIGMLLLLVGGIYFERKKIVEIVD